MFNHITILSALCIGNICGCIIFRSYVTAGNVLHTLIDLLYGHSTVVAYTVETISCSTTFTINRHNCISPSWSLCIHTSYNQIESKQNTYLEICT